MWVMRREPSTSREIWTSRSNALEICSRIARSGRSTPAVSTSVSSRGERVARRVRVDRRQRALVARVHRLEHVERLGAADLADDDPVGAHAQGVADELANPDLALALDVRRARLERDHVLLLELELGGVLDRDDALVAGHERRHRVQRRRLTGAGTAGDEHVQLPAARTRRGTERPSASAIRTRSGRPSCTGRARTFGS